MNCFALCLCLIVQVSSKRLKAIVEEKSFEETHVFTVSNSTEYFVKFQVPEHLKEKYNADPDKHIFQVSMF